MDYSVKEYDKDKGDFVVSVMSWFGGYDIFNSDVHVQVAFSRKNFHKVGKIICFSLRCHQIAANYSGADIDEGTSEKGRWKLDSSLFDKVRRNAYEVVRMDSF